MALSGHYLKSTNDNASSNGYNKQRLGPIEGGIHASLHVESTQVNDGWPLFLTHRHTLGKSTNHCPGNLVNHVRHVRVFVVVIEHNCTAVRHVISWRTIA